MYVTRPHASIKPGRIKASGWIVLLLMTGLAYAFPCRASNKPVMTHYMPWYQARPYSGQWGWHWTMNHFNPEATNRIGRREIASHYYPRIGPYDSADPAVLEYHVLLMKLAGIDGVIVDWYGKDDFNDYAVIDGSTTALLNYVRKAGLKFCLCYEDRSIEAEVARGYISPSNAVAHARQTMLYAEEKYLKDRAYLRDDNSKPVLLNFGPLYFKTPDQWNSILSALDPTNRPSFFTLNEPIRSCDGAFDWPPMHLSKSTAGVLSEQALRSFIDGFEARARKWPGFITTVFPRFHDIYSRAGAGPSWGFMADGEGAVFRSTLARAMTNGSFMVQLATWNDFGEGTCIEPTFEYGFRDLEIVHDILHQHLDSNSAHKAGDFTLALRLYELRIKHRGDTVVSARLEEVFQNIASGKQDLARSQISRIESTTASVTPSARAVGASPQVVDQNLTKLPPARPEMISEGSERPPE